jgi:hypothetical protein
MDHILLILAVQLIPLFCFFVISHISVNGEEPDKSNDSNSNKDGKSEFFLIFGFVDFVRKLIKFVDKNVFELSEKVEEENKTEEEIRKEIEMSNKQKLYDFMSRRKIKQKILMINLKIFEKKKRYPLESIKEIINS